MDINDSILFVWGHSHLLGTGFKGKLRNVQRKLKDSCMNYKRVNAYKLDPESIEKYRRVLCDFKPKVVIGYSCALDLFARQAGSIMGYLNNLKFVIATSEALPYEDSAETIASFFGSPLIMEYGGVDFGVVSYEKIGDPQHRAFWWSHFVETSDEGEVIITALHRRYLPLIRFATGDEISEAAYFGCGSVRSFAKVLGRKQDCLHMPDGAIIHSVGIFHSVHQIESAKGIQLLIDGEEFIIQLVSDGLSQQETESIRKRLNDLHPTLGKARIELVKDLDTNIAGKRRWIHKIS